MLTVTIENEFGGVVNNLQFSGRSEAIRNAKAGAKHEQGRAVISDEDDALVYEFKYEDGTVNGYDDEGNQVFNV